MKLKAIVLASVLAGACTFAVASPREASAPEHLVPPCHQFQHISGMAHLHDALNLTAAQEKSWLQFHSAVRPMHDGNRAGAKDFEKLTAPERADKMAEMSAKHAAALKTFYAVLTPAQRHIMDEFHPRGGPGQPGCEMAFKKHHGPKPPADDAPQVMHF